MKCVPAPSSSYRGLMPWPFTWCCFITFTRSWHLLKMGKITRRNFRPWISFPKLGHLWSSCPLMCSIIHQRWHYVSFFIFMIVVDKFFTHFEASSKTKSKLNTKESGRNISSCSCLLATHVFGRTWSRRRELHMWFQWKGLPTLQTKVPSSNHIWNFQHTIPMSMRYIATDISRYLSKSLNSCSSQQTKISNRQQKHWFLRGIPLQTAEGGVNSTLSQFPCLFLCAFISCKTTPMQHRYIDFSSWHTMSEYNTILDHSV